MNVILRIDVLTGNGSMKENYKILLCMKSLEEVMPLWRMEGENTVWRITVIT